MGRYSFSPYFCCYFDQLFFCSFSSVSSYFWIWELTHFIISVFYFAKLVLKQPDNISEDFFWDSHKLLKNTFAISVFINRFQITTVFQQYRKIKDISFNNISEEAFNENVSDFGRNRVVHAILFDTDWRLNQYLEGRASVGWFHNNTIK